jgi:hypothetical protein
MPAGGLCQQDQLQDCDPCSLQVRQPLLLLLPLPQPLLLLQLCQQTSVITDNWQHCAASLQVLPFLILLLHVYMPAAAAAASKRQQQGPTAAPRTL